MDKYFECTLCYYTTKNRSNLYHHNKTKKHLKKLAEKNNLDQLHPTYTLHPPHCTPNAPQCTENSLILSPNETVDLKCNYCNMNFTRSNSLLRHKNVCAKKHDKETLLKKQLDEYNHKFELLNCKLNKYEDKSKHFEEEAKYYKQMLMEAGGLVKKSVSALTYSITNYDEAPPIKTIQMDNINSFKNSTEQIVEDILSYYKHKTLCEHLGKIILTLYKKDDPSKQSIWNTDDTRLTYIVKELLHNKSSNWIVDKKGAKTVTYLIDPLLAHIKELIISYQKNFAITGVEHDMAKVEIILENSRAIVELINDIDDNVIAKDILRYISVHLRFNNNSILE